MILDNEIKDKLEKCKEIFPQIGIECINAFAGLVCEVNEPWSILERMPGDYVHNIILGTGNSLYQAIFGIGFKTDPDIQIIPSDSFEELCDAWCELANCYCGMLMDKVSFTESFGVLTQAIPQYSNGETFFTKAWACCGTLKSENGATIYMGYAIRKLAF